MKRILSFSLAIIAFLPLLAQNPIIGTSFTPDPAPYVHGDKVYLFVDHDEDDAVYFKMKDWLLYSTEDMVNWTYLGAPVSTATFPWAFQGDRLAGRGAERQMVLVRVPDRGGDAGRRPRRGGRGPARGAVHRRHRRPARKGILVHRPDRLHRR